MSIELPLDTTGPTAVLICIHAALADVTPLPLDERSRPFDEVSDSWGACRLFSGSEESIAEIVRANLCCIASQAGFGFFRIQRREHAVIHVTGITSSLSTPLQVWRSGDEFLTNGNAEFSYDFEKDIDDQPTEPWTLWGQGSTCLTCHKGRLDTTLREGASRALLRSLPSLFSPKAIALNFLRFALDPDDRLPSAMQLKCDHCQRYSIRCPYCHHPKLLDLRLPAFHVLRCEICGDRFRTPRDG